jgi:hypothetical protein
MLNSNTTLTSCLVRAIGLGLTSECNLACSFCYGDPARVDRLSLEQVRSAMASLPVPSVNLGTGENGIAIGRQMSEKHIKSSPENVRVIAKSDSCGISRDRTEVAIESKEMAGRPGLEPG